MRKILIRDNLYRGIDANYNRAKEGLRVCEDICRFVLDKRALTKNWKVLRHRLTDEVGNLRLNELLKARDIEKDVGKKTIKSEVTRKQVGDLFYANVQRVKESIRVLEEFTKLSDRRLAQNLKEIRYQVYGLEKKTFEAL